MPIVTPSTSLASGHPTPAVHRQVDINWPLLIERRPAKLAALGPTARLNYLLLPEVNQLLAAAQDSKLRLLIATLWYTGARISEARMLRVEDIQIQSSDYGFVTIKSLKKRGQQHHRVIEVYDPYYLDLIRVFVRDFKLRKRDYLFTAATAKPMDRKTALRQVQALGQQVQLPIIIGTKTFRHSFAINALLHGIDIKTIQTWLGHAYYQTTEQYLQIVSGDIGFKMQGVSFR